MADTKPPPFSVKGKTAIVTGAGSGINYCFAAILLDRGCNVLFADLALRPEAQQLLSKYNGRSGASGARAAFIKTDVTDWAQLENMFDAANEEFGGVDIVCPGAGIYDPHWSNFWHPPGVAGTKSKDDARGGRFATIDINLTHPIRATQLAISAFLEQKVSPTKPARVVIISSIAGQMSNMNTPMYVAAKHGMNGFIRSLGPLEERTGIRVNGVAPGVIKTPLWTEHPEKMTFLDAEKDEWATPEEVAEAMVRCLEEPELPGGTVLEVGAKQTRIVQQLNDPGPSGPGHTVSNLQDNYQEVFDWLGVKGWGKRSKL